MQVLRNLPIQPAEAPKNSPKGESSSFESQLKAQTEGVAAPPGPTKDGPPPAKAKGGEVAKNEPNALSQKPDSQPKQIQIDPNALIAQAAAVLVPPAIAASPTKPLTTAAVQPTAEPVVVATSDVNSANVPIPVVQDANSTQTPTVIEAPKQVPALSKAKGIDVVAQTPAATKSRLTRIGDAPARPGQSNTPAIKLDDKQTQELNVRAVDVKAEPAKTPSASELVVAVEPTNQALAITVDEAVKPPAKVSDQDKNSATKAGMTSQVSQPVVETAKQGSDSSHGQQPSEDQEEKPASKIQGAKRETAAVNGDFKEPKTVTPKVKLDEPDDGPQADFENRKISATPIIQSAEPRKAIASTDVTQPARQITPPEVASTIRQASDRIALLAATRAKEAVVIRLSPPDLGDLTIAVKTAGQRVDAQITASNDGVKQALQTHASQLGQSLSQRGIELNSLTFGTQSNGSSKGESTAYQSQAQGQQQSHQQGNGQQPVSKPIARQMAFAAPQDGVDMRI